MPTSDPSNLLVSYAQHGEDIVLQRALSGTENGFYVDVGAFHPTVDSVTALFYERGWRGVNIDPDPAAIALFDAERTDEVNLAVAAGGRDGETVLFTSDVPGWSTTSQAAGTRLASEAHVTGTRTVPVRRLSSILDELDQPVIDFLKVDAEGSEPEVIAGLDLARHRPRVVVLEGIAPGVDPGYVAPAVQALVDAGYLVAGFDGLNHYLTCEPELVQALSTPANPTDGYLRHETVSLQERVAAMRADRDAAWAARDEARRSARVEAEEQEALLVRRAAQHAATRAELDALAVELAGIKAGISWRLTAPIRRIGDLVRAGRRPTPRTLLARLDDVARRHPERRERLIVAVDRLPAVGDRARRALAHERSGVMRVHVHFDAVTDRRVRALASLEQRARARQGAQ